MKQKTGGSGTVGYRRYLVAEVTVPGADADNFAVLVPTLNYKLSR